jgi:hypothetical protein
LLSGLVIGRKNKLSVRSSCRMTSCDFSITRQSVSLLLHDSRLWGRHWDTGNECTSLPAKKDNGRRHIVHHLEEKEMTNWHTRFETKVQGEQFKGTEFMCAFDICTPKNSGFFVFRFHKIIYASRKRRERTCSMRTPWA